MSTLHHWLGSFSAGAWPAVADHLWQTTVLALIVWLTSLALKSGPARTRHALWLIASLKFVIPSALLTVVGTRIGVSLNWLGISAQPSFLEGITMPASLLANNYTVTVVAQHSHNELYCVFSLVWLTGVITLLSAWGIRVAQFRRAMNRGRNVTQGNEWEALLQARRTLNLKKDVRLVISSLKTEPAVCGSWKPVIVLPESITEHLSPAELQAIMLHELVHVQRHDNPIGKLQLALSAAFWFHPLIWFIGRKLSDEREQSCDERVLQLFSDRDMYAASILKVVRFSFGWKVAGVAGAGSGSNLRRRIENIMRQSERGKIGIRSRLLIVAFASVALALVVTTALYGRARTASVPTIADSATIDTQHEAVALSSFDQKRQPAAPPAPPNPTNPTLPPAPPQSEEDNAGSPAQPAQPANPVQPAAPTQPAAPAQPAEPANESQPASPEVPPLPPARSSEPQEKSKPRKGNVQNGELIEAPRPVYPEEAREQKVEGTVTVTIVIDEEGKVITAKPASGPALLHDASKEAALKARFKPTLVDGKPAKVAGAMTYNFVLDQP